MSLFQFLLPSSPLWVLPHLQLLIYVRLLTQKKAPAMVLQSPVHNVLPSLSSLTLSSAVAPYNHQLLCFHSCQHKVVYCVVSTCTWLSSFYCTLHTACIQQVLSKYQGFPGGASGKEHASNAGDIMRHGLDPWVGKRPWRRAGNPLQYSCMENLMDRGAQQATGHRVEKSWT